MTCAVLDLIGIARMELVILHMMTKRYMKSPNSFDISFMSTDKLSIK